MKRTVVLYALCALLKAAAFAQTNQAEPHVLTKAEADDKIAVVEVAARFVTTIRLPDAVNSVVVGDPSEFQVEHSDREPKLVFVKAISSKARATNLLISTTTGHQVSLLLINRGGDPTTAGSVDFLVKYEPPADFFVPPSGFPFALIGATIPLTQGEETASAATPASANSTGRAPSMDPHSSLMQATKNKASSSALDQLLDEQQNAPLPVLYGERVGEESVKGDHVRAGVSRVIDEGQQVIVLFSVINSTKHAILLMPPQVQLGGRITSGKVVRHEKWTTAEQLPVEDFRLNRRRLGIGERADGVVVFERPPYKQSSETLLLQVAEAGAVDRPALAPIGFGVSTAAEAANGRGSQEQ
ncbi:MAG: hypothetical protein WBD87_05210 [Candidatus Acidiferrales bacterium]